MKSKVFNKIQIKISLALFLVSNFLCSICLAQSYTIDPQHSRIEFKVKHLGIGWVVGQFTEFSGKFVYDPKEIQKSYVDATIKAYSLDTGTVKRDKHLKSPVFLDTLLFKDIRFLSNKITATNQDEFKVTGVLTIKEVAKEVTLDVTHGGSIVDPWGVARAGFHASTVINRKDFKLTWNRLLESGALLVGDEINISMDIQGVELKDNTPKLIDPSLPNKKS